MLCLRAHLFFACYLRHLEAYYLRALVFKKGFSLFSIVLNASWGFFEEIFEDTLENFEKMDRLERDLLFFKQELERERDQFRRNLLLGQIRDIEEEILADLRRQRARAERENKNLQEALEAAIQMKKK